MTMSLGGQGADVANVNRNPFGLVYENAITENVPGKVQIRPVE